MKERNKRMVLLGLMTITGLLATIAMPVEAAVVWSEDFNDGNYDGWTVEIGEWAVVDGALDADTAPGKSVPCKIWNSSSQVVGTWKFSVYHNASTTGEFWHYLYVNFMLNDTSGYGIRITHSGSIYLMKYDDDSPVPLRFIIVEEILDTWTHYTVTRTASGEFNVYLNATTMTAEPDISFTDTTYDYSERFQIVDSPNYLPYWGYLVDDIVVDAEILVTPIVTDTSTTDTEASSTTTGSTTGTGGDGSFPVDPLLLAAVGGGVVVLLVIVVLTRRR